MGDIPDFVRDAATLAEYEAAKAAAQHSETADAEGEIRATYARKHQAVLAEIASATAAVEEKRKLAEQVAKSYAESFPQHVHGKHITAPSFFENLLSFGRASRLYGAATHATEDVLNAQTALRHKQQAEDELETWLKRQLAHTTAEHKEQSDQADWLEKFHARPEIAELLKRVQAIRQEREDFARRLAAGQVTGKEQRDRWLAENSILPLRPPFESTIIDSIGHFGDLSCWVFVDQGGNKSWLPYDRRLAGLVDATFDVYRLAGDFEAKFTRSEDGHRRASPLDRFLKSAADEAEAHAQWRNRASTLQTQKNAAKDSPVEDPVDQKTLDLLAGLAKDSTAAT